MKALKIEAIRVDGGTQMRAKLCEETVEEYTRLFKSGAKLPPVDVFFDGTDHWLADGFQRLTGAYDAGHATIQAVVHKGTQRDAILFACGANSDHGLKRTNADKRRAVETLLNDEEWVKWSDVRIAEAACVSQEFARQVRKELTTVVGSAAAKAVDQPRIGKDGKERKAPAPKADREPKAVPKHVVDTPDPKAGKPKISGGNTFNVEEFGDKSAVEDEAGNRIPDELVPVFGQKDAFDDVLSHLSKAKSAIERLLDTPAGGLIKNSLASIDLKNIYTQVKFAKPFAVCPRKSHKNCDTCKGRGWINEDVHKEIVKREGAA
jgi:hypothetical protein